MHVAQADVVLFDGILAFHNRGKRIFVQVGAFDRLYSADEIVTSSRGDKEILCSPERSHGPQDFCGCRQ